VTRLDDVQAAHDAIDNLLSKEMTMTPTRHHAAEHAAVPGLLAIARAALKGAYTHGTDYDWLRVRKAIADFEAGRDG
jgi:hypothetical protein